MRVSSLLLSALAVGALSASAFAQPGTWIERNSATPGLDQNHAGSIAGQTFGDDGEFLFDRDVTAGDTPLTTITGQLVARQRLQSDGITNLRSLDADLYCIHITDPAGFSAIASGLSSPDLSLALFTSTGVAVAYNDNRTDSATSVNPRLINNGFALDANGELTVPVVIPGLTAGDYILGISRKDGGTGQRRFSRPLDAAGNLLFAGMTNGATDASDPAGVALWRSDQLPISPAGTLASWELFSTTAAPFNTTYTISLAGCTYCVIPAPGATAVLGLAGLAALRRRR